jgi:hypothetical protein
MLGRRQTSRTMIPTSLTVGNRVVIPPPSKVAEKEDPACIIIQAQKDKLLTSLASYFAKEIEKDALKADLKSIKETLAKDCPVYVQTSPCC